MKELVLVIEDDNAIRNLITTTLSAFGYEHRAAANGGAAIREAVSAQPDLFILDLGLPDMDGVEIIAKLRSWTHNPIIVVSARGEVEDKIQALDAGADDYLTKPFSVEELLARVRVALRKMSYEQNNPSSPSTFVNGGLTIDHAAGCVFVDGAEVHITPIEYKLLTLLAQNVGKVLTHNYILKEVWASTLETDTQSLRVFMATLRKKIEKNTADPLYLQTHVGIGYRMMRITDQDQDV